MAEDSISILRPELLGRMTQRAVVEALRTKGPMSRADISRLTGISPTTVSSAVAQVLKAGFVEETPVTAVGPGRPGKMLRLAAAGVQVLGVSVEPDWCELITAGLDGHPLPGTLVRFPTPNTYARLLAEIERVAKPWLTGPVRTLGLGLSLPGIIDPAGDRAVFSPNLHQTDDQRPARDLSQRLGIPCIQIQEANALCLAERRYHGVDDLAVLDYSGGLGVGVLVAGRLLAVPRELGHVTVELDGRPCGCGNRGCLETVATDTAFARQMSLSLGRPLTVEEALAAYDVAPALDQLQPTLDYLAVAVAAVANLFSPPLIVLHGRLLARRLELIEHLATQSLIRKLRPFRDRCRLVVGRTSKAEGAIAGVLDSVFEALGPMLPT